MITISFNKFHKRKIEDIGDEKQVNRFLFGRLFQAFYLQSDQLGKRKKARICIDIVYW